jgi:hypothetical protein
MFKKNIIGLMVLSAAVFASPVHAAYVPSIDQFHPDFILSNDTVTSFTGMINDRICSGVYGSQGIIQPHSVKRVYYTELNLACGANISSCQIDLYPSEDCSGTKIGTVTIDVNEGVTGIYPTGRFDISAPNPFEIQIDATKTL